MLVFGLNFKMRHFRSLSCTVHEVFFVEIKIQIFFFLFVRVFFRATHWDNLVLELLTRLTMTLLLPSEVLICSIHDLVVIVDHEWKQ